MGIHGIYKEIGSGVRIALAKLALQKFEQTGRPLRLAIDTSIWLFQIQSSKGGTNPALRTFYYRLLRLMSLSIHPLFVFDGPNRPEFKRNKRVGGGKAQVASIPEFLAKQLLKQFGFPCHLAPGEAEAECALLQREGIVDAVLSEDVDTLMFGSRTTIKNWSPPHGSKSKTPTHVDLFDANATKETSGLDREGMVLVALMSGGDYITQGIPGVGPKVACEAARAGFGAEICRINKKDASSLAAWRERLQHELLTNESKYFRTKHQAITIPEDFPNLDVLGYYTHPVVSSQEKLNRLQQSLSWDMAIDYPALRSFTADAFSWTNLGGAKHFIRNLAPPVLIRELRLRGQAAERRMSVAETEQEESQLVHSIHGTRIHGSTDNCPELRIAYTPLSLVPIDLDAEEPDEEIPIEDEADEAAIPDDVDAAEASKPRAPTKYDPTTLEKAWVMESIAKVGVPLKVQDWHEAHRDPKKYLAMKHANKAASKTRSKASKTGGMRPGALDQFTRITKPGLPPPKDLCTGEDVLQISSSQPVAAVHSAMGPPKPAPEQIECISLVSPPRQSVHPPTNITLTMNAPPTTAKRRKGPLQRAQTSPASLFSSEQSTIAQADMAFSIVPTATIDLTNLEDVEKRQLSPNQNVATKRARTGPSQASPIRGATTNARSINNLPSSQQTIDEWVKSPQRQSETVDVGGDSSDPLVSSVTGLTSENSTLQIRTMRYNDELAISCRAVAAIDLTQGSPKHKRTFPHPTSYMTPAEVATTYSSFEKELPRGTRQWNKYPVLTETDGNQPPPERTLATHALHVSSGRQVGITRSEKPIPEREKGCAQVSVTSDGFWEEGSVSQPCITSSQARKPSRSRQVWPMDDLHIIDLTTSS